MRSPAARAAFLACVVFVTWLYAMQAWVVDDAYITLRTVDNFVNGYGLRWNPAERVQVYTHPAWMFLMSACYFFTGESFLTVLALSYALLMGLILLVRQRHLDAPWRVFTFLALLVSSKAFFDYTSSGLENPLTSLLIGLFFLTWLEEPGPDAQASPRRYGALVFLAAMAFFNRMDTILLFVPALVAETLTLARQRPRSVAWILPLASAPAWGWLVFSVIYYGMPFPNTAYAKALPEGLQEGAAARAGYAYFLNSLTWDPPTLGVMALTGAWALDRRKLAPLLAVAGFALYLVYVARVGALGTHMSGRFFSAPFLVAVLVLIHLAESWRESAPALALLGLMSLISPGHPLRSIGDHEPLGDDGRDPSSIVDTRSFAQRQGAALSAWARERRAPDSEEELQEWPRHRWYEAGLEFREGEQVVNIGGDDGSFAVGYFAFGAGPDKFVIDKLALTDPLLCHMPMDQDFPWWPGHFRRTIPPGYVRSVEENANHIADPDLKQFYMEIRRITRAPLFRGPRWKAIWKLNTGQLQPLLDRYEARQEARRNRSAP